MQNTASKSNDAHMARKAIISTHLKIQIYCGKVVALPKSSESIDLREGYVIFEYFKNVIKTMIKHESPAYQSKALFT